MIEMSKSGIIAESHVLSIGDYAWVLRKRNQSNLRDALFLGPIIERKKNSDFACSIKDNRYEEQKFRLKKFVPNRMLPVLSGI